MLRAVLALGGTAAGLAAILSFKTHPAAETSMAPMSPPSGGTASSAPGAGQAAGAGKASSAPKPGSRTTKPGSRTTKPGGGSTATATARTITGAVASTRFGPMQVAVTMVGMKITGVQVLQQTDSGSLSQQIDANSIPTLKSETLAAQSAQIDAVSGATYTSEGYKQSLQSALDKA